MKRKDKRVGEGGKGKEFKLTSGVRPKHPEMLREVREELRCVERSSREASERSGQ